MVLSSPCGHAVLGSGSRCDAPGEPAAIGTTGRPPPGETGAWRRLTRRMDRRVFAGVASGLGDYFNVDPVVFRVAFVVLSFPGGAAASGRTWGGLPPGGVDTTARAWGEPPPDGWTVRRSRSNLGWVTLAVAFLAVGMAAFLDNVGMVELTIGRVLALFLTVIGIGLVVGAVLHQRSILLVLLGLLLVPVVVLASVLNVPLRGGVGPRLWQPRSVAEIRGQYELASGDLVIDLSGVKFGKEPTRVNARVGIGRVAVYLPQDVPVEMDAKNGVGVVQFPDRQDEGGVQVSTHASAAGSERVGRLSLDLEAGYGLVQVVRGTPPPDTWSRDGHIQGWDGAQRRPPAVEVGR